MSSQSSTLRSDSSPSTSATTFVQSPSPKSQQLDHEVHDHLVTSSVTPTPGHPLDPKMYSNSNLHQKQVKQEQSHSNHVPPVESMGRRSHKVKRNRPTPPRVNDRPSLSLNNLNPSTSMIYNHNPLGMAIKPHPHITGKLVYVHSYPANMSENEIVDAVRGCLPTAINITTPVPPEMRLRPDIWYDWMPKTGTIEFWSEALAERALAILVNYAHFSVQGVRVSPYPACLTPFPAYPTAIRYIRPTRRSKFIGLPANLRPEAAYQANYPTPGEVYDAVRPWGSVRWVNSSACPHDDPDLGWTATVEFWYEDEARHFDQGFGQTASLIKGCEVFISPAAPINLAPPVPLEYPIPPPTSLPPINSMYTIDSVKFHCMMPYNDSTSQPFQAYQPDSMYLQGDSIQPSPASAIFSHLPVMSVDQMSQFTPPISYVEPWAEHNMFASGNPLPEVYMDNMIPMTPDKTGRRLSMGGMPRMNGRSRNWSLTIEKSPDGQTKPTGLIADDGTFIQHGPGQHIRPAPPGSTSVSGLVDYSNVFVKNLDPDINCHFLSEIFSNVGQVVSARVMRDDQGRSRSYGFVSFHSPEQAANAIAEMHGQKLGQRIISVALHQPRKLRPEKIAERALYGSPMTFGRQSCSMPRRSTSPDRTARTGRGRHSLVEEPRHHRIADEIRSLSPSSRKRALAKQIHPRASSYAREKSIAHEYVEKAVQLLASQDLSLIPLLHDKTQLDIRVAEAFVYLSSETVKEESDKDQITTEIIRPTNQDLVNLRAEIIKMDPINVNDIMPIIIEMLTEQDWETIWDQHRIARKYGLAKQQLDKDTEKTDKSVPEQVEVKAPEPQAVDTQEISEQSINGNSLVSLEDLNLDLLASLPSKQILLNLESEIGNKVLELLGIAEPAPTRITNNRDWISKVMKKDKVARGIEIASALGKLIESDTLKRSQRIKVIKALIDAEEEQALCGLMVYPAILNSKVKMFVKSQAQ
ncbi:uncharacterized protein I206_103430 [Kwoniella pini CBS 10737]|uniref:RRM domain-containing protein n=1 Tax=Kwoniella pini CBS 10737 TaxID=1296096 RepID=A0A1B9I9S6_9TREE|nr:uncharacterized protein I206_01566 [Kwoniella pini CBS 10737]OCF52279.1 hypothetical protein I206_01566 [Kwoniella pini CBS 10737]